jgi:hypothetical protein
VSVVASPAEAALLVTARRYGLVLVTNFGVRPDDALAVIPPTRDYPVLFLTGDVSDRVQQTCREKSIPLIRMPEAVDTLRGQLRLALEDLRV